MGCFEAVYAAIYINKYLIDIATLRKRRKKGSQVLRRFCSIQNFYAQEGEEEYPSQSMS